jgi:hypothetical protein
MPGTPEYNISEAYAWEMVFKRSNMLRSMVISSSFVKGKESGN